MKRKSECMILSYMKIIINDNNYIGGLMMNKKFKDNGNTASNPKTGNTKSHISSKAGMKDPEAK